MDLVVPSECAGCGRPRAVVCAVCARALHSSPPRRVHPVPEPSGLPAVYAAAPYADAVRALLLAHKERGALALARPLGTALAAAVRAAAGGRGAAAGPVLLVPVPSAGGAVRARGHDPVRRIALAAAAELRRSGTPARVLAALRQRRAVADQSSLSPAQRGANVAGALGAAPGTGAVLRAAGRVVLVDDLVTTGATLAEAARALSAAGVEKRTHAAAVAAAPDSTGAPGPVGARPRARLRTPAEGRPGELPQNLHHRRSEED
ncbi:hypothetical protein GCM10018793_21330 [Streptomyces sulfonofaciens]|uniref:Phosphoribosyltransferase domain-containing protein n=2 Tax=Streptomyces sulfonofaciens TaxID=68272 RepID=A0A919G309_9ACTN|nr:hypothetical protein GCM10018793_21330 [Streptomyces sulfonofaciens]